MNALRDNVGVSKLIIKDYVPHFCVLGYERKLLFVLQIVIIKS